MLNKKSFHFLYYKMIDFTAFEILPLQEVFFHHYTIVIYSTIRDDTNSIVNQEIQIYNGHVP